MRTMRAAVITGPSRIEVAEVPTPAPGAGEVLVDIELAGVCGTDVELFTGDMAYLHQGFATYPVRPGHEWCGTVIDVGHGVDRDWIGRRVIGDTMVGCGACRRCRNGRQHVCADRGEVGLRNGWPGALAEQLVATSSSLHALPAEVDATMGALVEPGANAYRGAAATLAGPEDRVAVIGPGTIGTLAALFLRARGVEVHVLGEDHDSMSFVRGLGFDNTWTVDSHPTLPFDAVVDCTNSPHVPAKTIDLVEPGGRVVLIGIAVSASQVDTRDITLGDVTAVGILSGSPALGSTIEAYATGVDPRPLVDSVVGLDQLGEVLAGRYERRSSAPKVLVDPRL